MTSTHTGSGHRVSPLTAADLATPIELPEVGSGSRRSRRHGGRRDRARPPADATPVRQEPPPDSAAAPMTVPPVVPVPAREEASEHVPVIEAPVEATPGTGDAEISTGPPQVVELPSVSRPGPAHASAPPYVPAPPHVPAPTPVEPERPARYVPQIERRAGPRSLLVLLASIAILAAALVLLGWVVYDRVASGPDPVPTSPASVPSPVQARARTLVVHTDGERLVGATIAALDASGRGGSLVFVPPGTMLEVPGATLQRLDQAAVEGGVDAVRLALENLIGVPFAGMTVLAPQDWSELLAEQGTLTVENPAPLSRLLADGSTELVHPAGPIDVGPEEIPELLAGQSPGEDALDRLVRHQRVWESVLGASARPVPAAEGSPDPGDGLTGVVEALGGGDVDYRILPVDLVDPAADLYVLDEAEAGAVLDSIAPERHAGAGADRVQLLNGVGTPGLAGAIASILVPQGLSVPLTDNADRFGYATTQIVYYRPEASGTAAQVRELLGVGEVVKSRSVLDAVDVTVVIGKDLAERLAGAVEPAAAAEPAPVEGEVAGA